MKKARPRYVPPPPSPPVVFQVSVRLDVNEMTRTLKPGQIAALMQGIAQVVAVTNRKQWQGAGER